MRKYFEPLERFRKIAEELASIHLNGTERKDLDVSIEIPERKLGGLHLEPEDKTWHITGIMRDENDFTYTIFAGFREYVWSWGTPWHEDYIGQNPRDEYTVQDIMGLLGWFENIFIQNGLGIDPKTDTVDYAMSIAEEVYRRSFQEEDIYDGSRLGFIKTPEGNLIEVKGMKEPDDTYASGRLVGTIIGWTDPEKKWRVKSRCTEELEGIHLFDTFLLDILLLLDDPAERFMSLDFYGLPESFRPDCIAEKMIRNEEEGVHQLDLDILANIPDFEDYVDWLPEEENLSYMNLIKENIEKIMNLTGFKEINIDAVDEGKATFRVTWKK